MSNYFSQFIPHLGSDSEANVYLSNGLNNSVPKIQYITIFNPDLISERAEDNEELFKQIVFFVSLDAKVSLELEQIEQLKVVGLVRGIDSFARNFVQTTETELDETTIIKASNSSIIVQNLESRYYLAYSVSMIEEKSNKSYFVNQQLIRMVQQAYHSFVLLNGSFTNILTKYSHDILQDTLLKFWSGFMESFNHQAYTIPPGLLWPNTINYRGFLGLVPDNLKRTFKRSSLSLSHQAQAELDHIIADEEPKGVIISYFNKLSPKKYGVVFMSNFEEQGKDDIISKDSLIDIYNWLEYHDGNEKLNTSSLANFDGKHVFKSNIVQPELEVGSPEPDSEAHPVQKVTASAMEFFNPINLTNNLVVSPLNYTVNSMKSFSLGSGNNTEQITHEDEEVPIKSTPWYSIPPMLRNISSRLTLQPEDPDSGNLDEESEEEPSDQGEYLIGLTNDSTIERRLVYMKTTVSKDGVKVEEEREHLLVVFRRLDFYITLVLDSSNTKLDNNDFYETLQHEVFNPAIDELYYSVINGSMLGSTGSIRSLNGLIRQQPTEVDNDFFFTIYDSIDGSVKSSLPYLPTVTGIDTPRAKYQSAMFYLHDQLSQLFLMQRNKDFFNLESKMDEYFHKFTSNKLNDWMFYYFRHKEKFIIIIMNRNRAKAKKKGPAPNQTMLNRISDGVYDYTNLGFLENLGDDVKVWLEGFISSGDT